MKVAHLTTVDLSLRYLIYPQLLAARDAGAESIAISAPGPYVEEIEAAGIRHVPLPGSTRGVDWRGDLLAMLHLWKILRRERPDVLHTHNPKPGIYGRIIGRLAGVPVVVNTVHGLYATEDDPWLKRLFVYGLEAVASRFSHRELYQSPEDLALARRLRIVSSDRSLLLGNGVDLERFSRSRFTDAERAEVRSELVGDDARPIVGIVGRLVAEKGYPELFEAFQELSSEVNLVVVGPDDPTKPDALSRDVVADAQRAGVRFLGMRSDVDRLYQAFDIFVLPSHREGFPRAAMEAAASGVPIIATDVRGCRQVVDHGVNGLLVSLRSPADLREAISDLASDADKRRAMAEASVAKAVREFDERDVVQTVMNTHRTLSEIHVSAGLLAPANTAEPTQIRQATSDDAASIAHLHSARISSGFLASLGPGALAHIYRSMIASGDDVVLVAVNRRDQVVGFVAGTSDTAATYRSFLTSRRALQAGIAAVPRLVRPSTWRRVIETLRYGSGSEASGPELLSMAVASSHQGRGIASQLGQQLLESFRHQGCTEVRVIVGSENERAIGLYQSLGFSSATEMSLHAESPSLEMVCRL